MAKLYGEIPATSKMSFDVSFARLNGQPLDASEVYYSLAAAEEYAAGGGAYVGQKIVVIENGIVTHYGIENENGTLKELGAKPVADGTTISIGTDGKITLANINAVKEGTYNAVLVDGVLTWVKPSTTTVEGLSDLISALTGRVEVIESDINDIKRINNEQQTAIVSLNQLVKTNLNDINDLKTKTGNTDNRLDDLTEVVDNHKSEYNELVGRVNTAENDIDALEGRMDNVEDDIDAIEIELAKKAINNINTDDDVLAVTDNVLSATVSLGYNSEDKTIELYGKNKVVLGSVDATPFIKDGMLDDVSYDPDNNTLTFTWNTDGKTTSDTVVLSDIIEPYTAGDGLVLDGNKFKVKLDSKTENFLVLTSDGLKVSGITQAIADAKASAIADAKSYTDTSIGTAKSELEDYAEAQAADALKTAKEYTDTKKTEAINAAAAKDTEVLNTIASTYATKEYVGDIPDNYTETNIIAYINKKAEETLSAANGGSSESAASVAQALETYKAENNPKVAKNAEDIVTINNKLKDIEDSADANVIESIEVTGVGLTTISATIGNDRKATIDLPVYTKTDIDGKLDTINGTINGVTGRVTTNEGEITTLKGNVSTLQNTTSGNSTEISNIWGEINGVGDIAGIKSRLTAVELIAAEHSAITGAINKNTEAISEVSEDLAEVTGIVNSHTTTLTGVDGKGGLVADVSGLKTTTSKHEGRLTALESMDVNANNRLLAIEGKVGRAGQGTAGDDDYVEPITGTLETAISGLSGRMTTAEGDIDALEGRMTTAEGDIDALEGRMTTAEGDIDTLQEQIEIWAGEADENENKADKSKSIRTIAAEETAKIVAGADTRYDTLKEIADWITSDTTGAASMNSAITKNAEDIGALQTRMTTAEGKISSQGSTLSKLEGNVNTEGSILNLIDANNKTYVDANFVKKTTIATNSILGLVMSSSLENKISVAADGTMEVNSLNVNKLTQTAGDTLILSGGTANA